MFAKRYYAIGWVVSGLLASGCGSDAADSEDPTAEEQGLIETARSVPPVVLVAGLMQDEQTVAPLADVLRARGLDVTVWIPPDSGLGDINEYADQLGKTIEEVRHRTGAARVDLVGHSEGGLTARRYLKSSGDGAAVRTLVSLGSPQQGTEGGLLSDVLRLTGCELWAPSCKQMVAGSEFLVDLNGGDATPGKVRYVTVGTRQDGVVQPVARAAIPGAENVIMQKACPFRIVGHFGLLGDAWVHQVVISVLAGSAPAGNCRARPVGSLL